MCLHYEIMNTYYMIKQKEKWLLSSPEGSALYIWILKKANFKGIQAKNFEALLTFYFSISHKPGIFICNRGVRGCVRNALAGPKYFNHMKIFSKNLFTLYASHFGISRPFFKIRNPLFKIIKMSNTFVKTLSTGLFLPPNNNFKDKSCKPENEKRLWPYKHITLHLP